MTPLQDRFTPYQDREFRHNDGVWLIWDHKQRRAINVRIRTSEIIPVCTQLEAWVEGRDVELSECTIRVLRKCGYAFTLGELYSIGREPSDETDWRFE